ncbi:MAG: RnfABCDGE type electron transport complex subunit G [Kiritimatiellaeota bacterium]|nr:RnfABCDGE type electron transport complex subunit G [Kiritimatiellota bacterium]
MIRLVFVLTVICAVSSALLAAVYTITKEPIALAKEQSKRLAAAHVMPAGLPEPEKVTVEGETFFICQVDGEIVAAAVVGRSQNGYGGLIELMVGISDGKLVGYEVVSATETPGLGTKIAGDAFKKPLMGKALTSNWTLKKNGGDVDAVTAATISSRAAIECITDAIAKLELLGKR